MKSILKYIGYFMAVLGFATVIWKAAVFFTTKDNQSTNLEIAVKDIKGVVQPLSTKYDSLYAIVKRSNRGQSFVRGDIQRVSVKLDTLTKKFILHVVKTDSTATKLDIMNLQNDLDIKKNIDPFSIR
jgi:hypothetical protein